MMSGATARTDRPVGGGENPIIVAPYKIGNSNQNLPNRTPLSRRSDSLSHSSKGGLGQTKKTSHPTATSSSSKELVATNTLLATVVDKENGAAQHHASFSGLSRSLVSTPHHARMPAAVSVSRGISSSPYTLLSLEMNHGYIGNSDGNDADESLLVSPLAGGPLRSFPSTQHSESIDTVSPPIKRNSSAIESNKPVTQIVQNAEASCRTPSHDDQVSIGCTRAMPLATRVSNLHQGAVNPSKNRKRVKQSQSRAFPDNEQLCAPEKPVVADSEQVARRKKGANSKVLTKPLTPLNETNGAARPSQQLQLRAPSPRVSCSASTPALPVAVSSVAQWSVATKQPLFSSSDLQVQQCGATPFTTRGSAVRLDLSNILTGAANGTTTKLSNTLDATSQLTTGSSSIKPSAVRSRKSSISSANGDDWAEKQVQTFTTWLNYLFYPIEAGTGNDGSSVSRTGLRSFVSHQRLAQGRLAASTLYKKSDMSNFRQVISTEIASNRIAFRSDRDVNANLMHRDTITGLLLSYSTPWLRLGLETLFGTVIQPEVPLEFSPRGVKHQPSGGPISRKVPLSHLKLALKQFVIRHVLSDEKILAKYTGGRCKVPSGSFGERYRVELRAVVLYRVLVLIVFLDRAKTANVLEQAPNLFEHKAAIKSTRELLLVVCREFLKSEGDFVKHLSRIGIQVFYKQEAIDELDFTVTNLRIDLNDGVRLARMTELLTGAALLTKLRLPAVSRLQKIHNVAISLKRLTAEGVQVSDIESHHIVDGHREMVLKLLWSVISKCCLQALLTVDQVDSEITRIQKLLCEQPTTLDNTVAVLEDALLNWSHLVCSRFGKSVVDLSKSFADGKAVCLLIHFYHPTLLRLDEINEYIPTERYSLDNMLSTDRSNGILANVCMSDLGIFGMMPTCDTSHPPDEKSMLLCLAFLCSRLIDSSLEIRASVSIQLCFRRYRNRALRLRKNEAAASIFSVWKANKAGYYEAQRRRFGEAVLIIERFTISRRAAIQQARVHRLSRVKATRAAVLIQKHTRSRHAKLRFKLLVQRCNAVVLLQCCIRKALARRLCRTLLRNHQAAMTLQNFWNAVRYLGTAKNAAGTHIQRILRGYLARIQFVIDKLDIVAVQSCARRWLVTQRVTHLTKAAAKLQTMFRRCLAKSLILSLKARIASSLTIQTEWRRMQASLFVAALVAERDQIAAATLFQCGWRRWISKCTLKRLIAFDKQQKASIVIQSFWRVCRAQDIFRDVQINAKRVCAAVAIQAAYRTHQARWLLDCMRLYAKRTKIAVRLQAFWRCRLTYRELARKQIAAATIQSMFRRIAPMRFLSDARRSANVLQLRMRTWLSIKRYHLFLANVCLLQGIARQLVAKNKRSKRIRAVVTVQCVARRKIASFRFQEAKHIHSARVAASTSIQRCWRGSSTSTKFRLVVRDIVLIQKNCRRFAAKVKFLKRINAVRVIQSAVQLFLLQKYVDSLIQRAFEKQAAESGATVRIQSVFRGWMVHRERATFTAAATTVSRMFRGMLARELCHQIAFSIVLCQSVARRWLVFRVVSRRVASILCLQTAIRSFTARLELRKRKSIRAKASTEYFAATTIQRVFRGHAGRQTALEESSAKMIQTNWRSYKVHVDYMLSILAIIDIQAACRRFTARANYKRQLAAISWIQYFARFSIENNRKTRQTQASVIIQASFRKYACRNVFLRFQREKRSACAIQSLSRMVSLRSSFKNNLLAACIVQRYVRGYITRVELETKSFAAFEIQRIWRGYVAREYVAWNILAAIDIQSFARMCFAQQFARRVRNECLAAYHLGMRSALKIQSEFRRHILRIKRYSAASVVQNAVRMYVSHSKFRAFRRIVVHIQSMQRGKTTRCASSKRLATVIARAAKANLAAELNPRMKLGNRTKAALHVLLSSKSLSEIMDAVSILEVATRLSERCCVSFAETGAPDILFSLLRTCNRSLPHVKLLHAVLLTMANVARFDHLVSSMATTSGVEIFLDLVQMFRDKDFVFCLVVSLLELVMKTSAEVVALCASKENLKRLKGVRDLCVRKLSYTGAEKLAHRRDSLEVASQLVSSRRGAASREAVASKRAPDVRKGVRRLDRIIRMVEPDRQ